MAEVSLQRSRIVALVGQRKATGVAQHVEGSSPKAWLGSTPLRSTMRAKPAVVNGDDPAALVNTNGDFGSCSRCGLRRAGISSPTMGWVAGDALLGPAALPDGVGEIDLIPTQVCELGRSQTVAEGDKDHGRIDVARASGLGGIDQPVDLGAGQVLPSPIDRVRFSSRHSDCSIYSGWCHQFQR